MYKVNSYKEQEGKEQQVKVNYCTIHYVNKGTKLNVNKLKSNNNKSRTKKDSVFNAQLVPCPLFTPRTEAVMDGLFMEFQGGFKGGEPPET